MEYQAPFGSADPDAPYVDRNTPGAVAGSAVPGKAIEDPQRELVRILTDRGFVPDESDLGQVSRAINWGVSGRADIPVNGWQSAPPGAPAEGDRYVVLAPGSGAWAGQDGKIAMWIGGAWAFAAPVTGLLANYMSGGVLNVIYFDGAVWAPLHQRLAWPDAPSSSNEIVLAPSPPVTSHVEDGDVWAFRAATTNTGAMTMQVGSAAAAALTRQDGMPLIAGDVVDGQVYWAMRTGGAWRLMGGVPANATSKGIVELATAAEIETATAGKVVTADQLKAARRPFFVASSGGGNTNVPNSVTTVLTHLSASASFFNAGSSFVGGVFTCGAADAGVWTFAGMAALEIAAAPGGNTLRGSLARNGIAAPFDGRYIPGTVTGTWTASPEWTWNLAAGDTVDLSIFHNTGTNRSAIGGGLVGFRIGGGA